MTEGITLRDVDDYCGPLFADPAHKPRLDTDSEGFVKAFVDSEWLGAVQRGDETSAQFLQYLRELAE